ncbi:MAG: MFS transporter, partial [Acetobacteraceae bacterium]
MSKPALPFVLAMCLAQVLGMLSFATFQALIPTFAGLWRLSNTEAGWISGIYFAGYVGAVPVLASLTDRVDPRRVLAGSLMLGGASFIGFALWADGFWTALAFRALTGVGLAGTYMPGLKALSDRIGGPRQSRYVSFYTSSFGIGASLS